MFFFISFNYIDHAIWPYCMSDEPFGTTRVHNIIILSLLYVSDRKSVVSQSFNKMAETGMVISLIKF